MHTVCVLDPFSALQVPLPWGQALNQPLPEGREFWGPQGPALPAPCRGFSPLHPTPSAPPGLTGIVPHVQGGLGNSHPPHSSQLAPTIISDQLPSPTQGITTDVSYNKRKKKICRWMSKRKPRQRPFHGVGWRREGLWPRRAGARASGVLEPDVEMPGAATLMHRVETRSPERSRRPASG